jgi:hypothetical protein
MDHSDRQNTAVAQAGNAFGFCMDRPLRADSRNKSGDAYTSSQTAMMRRGLRAREKLLARYIKNGLIIEWDFTEPLIAKFLNKIGDEAKVN